MEGTEAAGYKQEMKKEAGTYFAHERHSTRVDAVRVVRRTRKLGRLLHPRKRGRVARINARRVTESPCASSRTARGVFFDVVYDIVWTIWISRYTADSC